MQAAYLTEFGAPLDVVHVGEVDDPLLGPDGILIQVSAAGVNPVDWKIVAGYLQGAFPHHMPLIPGWDVAGTAVAVGPAVTSVAPGDRVAAYARKDDIQCGTFAERVAVSDRAVAVVPPDVPDVVAGALPLVGLTAEQVLDAGEVGPGDVVLIHGSTGGVGSCATQLALLRGATVLGTASPGNLPVLTEWGAQPIDYTHDLVAQIQAAAPAGVDVVIDLVGGEALASTPQVLRPGGRLAGIVDAAGMAELAEANGYTSRYVFVRPDAAMLASLLDRVATGQLRIDVGQTFPLTEAAAALEAMKTGTSRGKIVITP